MKPWNVVVTCPRGGGRNALRELRYVGDFRDSGFRDVLLGNLEERAVFFDQLVRFKEIGDKIWKYIVRIVPIDETFSFTLETFGERLSGVIDAVAPRVPPGPFYVRLERRGHKGEIPTPDVEREMDGRIIALHERRGETSRVDFREFHTVVAVETFRDQGGVGVISREEMEKYPFIKVP